MWDGYATGLAMYGYAMCAEWRARGYKDTCLPRFEEALFTPVSLPPWMGNTAFHASHRAALLHKDQSWYGKFNWAEKPKLDYLWPTGEKK